MKPQVTNPNDAVKNTTSRREPLGAFCTDIEDATKRTADHGDVALDQHKTYLQETGRYFITSIPDRERRKYRSSDFWVPGDALWSVFYPENTARRTELITLPIWRLIAAIAYGLNTANAANGKRAGRLSVRGVILAGVTPIRRLPIFEKLTLYTGTTLNACGRLEKQAPRDTIIVGFVIPKGEVRHQALFESIARCPVIRVDEFRQALRQCQLLPDQGCKIGLDVLVHEERELLHFTGWQKREDLRGLDRYDIVTTPIRLRVSNDRGFLIDSVKRGRWERTEVTIPLKVQITSLWSLYHLLEYSKSAAFDYLKEIYQENDVKFDVDKSGICRLIFSGERCRPRVSMADQISYQVDFNKEPFCILATDHDRASGGDLTLIQTNQRNGRRVLCFCKVAPDRLSQYANYSDYIDSSSPCIEFTFS